MPEKPQCPTHKSELIRYVTDYGIRDQRAHEIPLDDRASGWRCRVPDCAYRLPDTRPREISVQCNKCGTFSTLKITAFKEFPESITSHCGKCGAISTTHWPKDAPRE